MRCHSVGCGMPRRMRSAMQLDTHCITAVQTMLLFVFTMRLAVQLKRTSTRAISGNGERGAKQKLENSKILPRLEVIVVESKTRHRLRGRRAASNERSCRFWPASSRAATATTHALTVAHTRVARWSETLMAHTRVIGWPGVRVSSLASFGSLSRLSILSTQRSLVRSFGFAHNHAEIETQILRNFAPT